MTAPFIIFHAKCADGLGALWAAWRALPDAEPWPASYGDHAPPEEKTRDRDVVIVDFSYSLEVLYQIAECARSVLVLDHHDTAREALSGLIEAAPTTRPKPSDLYGTTGWQYWQAVVRAMITMVGTVQEESVRPIYIAAQFDMERSGAGIAWDFFHWEPRPRVIDLLEDRDLWRFRHDPDTRALDAALHAYDFEDYDMLANPVTGYLTTLDIWSRGPEITAWTQVLAEGRAVVNFQRRLVEGILASATRQAPDVLFKVPLACVPGQLASEAGNLLLERHPDAPFVATYYDGLEHRHFSLRARKGGAHVGQIARHYGGGGHQAAAGFVRPIGWEGEK